MKLRNQLGQIMYQKNFSSRQLERISGVSHSTITRICNGETDPTQVTMILIARALKMQVVDIFDLTY